MNQENIVKQEGIEGLPDTQKCPKCGDELWIADCMNPLNNETRQLVACRNSKCTFRARPCEVYSRVVGYLRPTTTWNLGKAQEFRDRKTYEINEKFK